MTDSSAGHGPPPAAGHLEPYGIRVVLRPVSREVEPQEFLVALLQELAAECLASGGTIIGHLKCLLHAPGVVVACNLTSIREGARCSLRRGAGATLGAAPAPAALLPGQEGRLDLTVLVYGLSAATIDALVRPALSRLLEPAGVIWSVFAPEPEHGSG